MKNLSFILFIVLFVSGCATRYVPPVENVNLPKDSKVGVYLNMGEHPTHTHIGTTIFNNHVKQYAFDWQLQQAIFDTLKASIEAKTGMQVVLLDRTTLSDYSELDFVTVSNKQWKVLDASAALRESLLAQGIRATIAIQENQTLAELNCSQYGCAEFYSEGYGLFTRSFFGIERYYASSSFDISAEILDPAVDMVFLDDLWEMTLYSGKHNLISGFSDPADFNNITEEEMAPVKAGILSYIEKIANLISQYLNGNINQPSKSKS